MKSANIVNETSDGKQRRTRLPASPNSFARFPVGQAACELAVGGTEITEPLPSRAPAVSIFTSEASAPSPYGLDIIESCLTCKVRKDYLFCNLASGAIRDLETITSTGAYPKGAILFVEGQAARGVFVLCLGRAKLSTSSRDGKTIIVRIAEPGEILGLSAAVSGRPYEVTAEMLEPSQGNFVARQDFLNFLRQHGEAALRAAEQLSNNYHSAYEEIRSLGLSGSASEKLAKLLLERGAKANQNDGELRLRLALTHQEIAQLIGASRETVTRIFSHLKKKQILRVKGATLIIRNKAALEKLVSS
ncbi:MAG TPA: Crp/Fnr family transcriptional regulator [Terriglobales bacterium]|nr:Crp/Fnr family transcriptional regulator [Terriglobales bacterium]